VLIAVLVALLMLSLAVAALTGAGARQHAAGALHLQGARAQAGADAAANAALRELRGNTDHDADGGIGSISADASTANDPAFPDGTRFWATRAEADGVVTVTAFGQNGQARRSVVLTLSAGSQASGSEGASTVFFTRDSAPAVRTSSLAFGVWAAATVSGATPQAPVWTAAARAGDATLVLASGSGNALYYGRANASGVATYTAISTDIGSTSTRPFDVAAEPTSGDGLAVYWDQGANALRSRAVVNGALSAASGTPLSTNTVKWVRLVPLGSGNEIMALTLDTSKQVRATRWTGTAWNGAFTVGTTINDESKQGFDAALERTSGRLMVVMTDTTAGRVAFRTRYTNATWSAVSYLAGFSNLKLLWIRLVSVPNSDQVFLAAMDENAGLWTARWSGTAWSTPVQVQSNLINTNARRFDIGVSSDGSTTMLMYGRANTVRARFWNGTAWSNDSAAYSSIPDPETVLLRPGPTPGSIVGAVGISDGRLLLWSYSGSAFSAANFIGTTSTSYREAEWFAMPVTPGSAAASPATLTGWQGAAPY
jgi:hypothetical protein